MASALNVSGLTDYVNIHKDELFIKATVGARSLELVEIMSDVKWKDALQYLDSEVVLADGSVCGFNPQGSDVFTERYIETKAVKVEKEWCQKDFEKKAANYALRWEAGRETLPFEQKIAESNMNAIKEAVERLVWRGDATIGIDGWLAQATAETLVTNVTFATGSTTIAKVDAMVAAIPAKALAKGLEAGGMKIIGSKTQSHLVMIDTRNCAISARGAQELLADLGIHVRIAQVLTDNPNIKYDAVRFSSLPATTRGIKASQMEKLGMLIGQFLSKPDDENGKALLSKVSGYTSTLPALEKKYFDQSVAKLISGELED